MEMMFVMGKRTRSCCQATGAAAPVPMAANTSAEAGLQRSGQPGAAGGAPSPHGAEGAAAAPPGTPTKWGDGAVPPSLPACGSLSGGQAGRSGSPVPAAPEETFCPASSSPFSQCCSAGRALAVRTRGRGCCLQGGAVGPEGVSAEPLALPQLSSSGAWGVPFTHSAASSLLPPVHRSPSCGTASLQGWHNPGGSITCQIFTVKLCPEETSSFSSSSLLHLQPPWQG